MQYFISVPKSVYLSEEISSYEVTVYALIYAMCMGSYFKDNVINVENIAYHIKCDPKCRSNKEAITKAVQHLIDANKLIAAKYGESSYVINKEQFTYDGNFVQIPLPDLERIMNECGKSRYSLFHYYCVVVGMGGSSVGMNYFLNTLKIGSRTTLFKYNNQLEEMGLISVEHGGGIKHKKNSYATLTKIKY